MNLKIHVYGETNPFFINVNSEHPLSINSYLKIIDEENDYPICRIIKTESVKTQKGIQYVATAKIESTILKPINPDSKIVIPSFYDIKPYVMKTEPDNGFKIGEILGTEDIDIPPNYKNLFPMIYKGSIKEQSLVPYVLDYKKLYESPHIGLFGGSGSGKTFALKVIMEELMKRGIPTLLLDPHLEMDFSSKKDGIPEEHYSNFSGKFQIFTVGNNIGIDFCDLSTSEFIGIMAFSGELSPAMESVIISTYEKGKTYKEFKDRLELLRNAVEKRDNKSVPRTAEEEDVFKKYGSSVVSVNTISAILWRLQSLNYLGVFDKNIDKIRSAVLNRKVCVIRGDLSQLNILASYLITKLYDERRQFVDSKAASSTKDFFPPFIVAMDESHIFCPRTGTYTPATKILRTISQEGRKYGVFEIMATQRPSLLDTTVVAQMANKFIFRISIKEDLTSVEKETDLSKEEIQRLPYMESGECYVSSAISGKTVSIKTRSNTTQEKNAVNPFDELPEMSDLTPLEEFILSKLPVDYLTINNLISDINSELGESLKVSELTSLLHGLKDKGKLEIVKKGLGESYSTT